LSNPRPEYLILNESLSEHIRVKQKLLNIIPSPLYIASDKILQRELKYILIINQEIEMDAKKDRPYRKNLTSHGLIYMGEEEHGITIKNLSINEYLPHLTPIGKY